MPVKHKKVELTELFYDLVYVYAISQLTSLIHHLHHGVVPWHNFFSFAIGLIIYINSWMVQTVFTNRFGVNNTKNGILMLAQMVCLLVSSVAITNSWEESFKAFILPVAGISFIHFLQYLLEYKQAKKLADRAFIRNFLFISGSRTLILLLASLLPYRYGLIVAVFGVILTWVLPSITVNPNRNKDLTDLSPINFPHLMERLSLLVIITFGEMLIGIAPYFTAEAMSIVSVLIFMIVTSLFMIYIAMIDHVVDVNRNDISGHLAIYGHYPIFFGLSFVTVALKFISETEANAFFSLSLLYTGMGLVILGTFLQSSYAKTNYQIPRWLYALAFGLPVFGYLMSLAFLHQAVFLIVIACLVPFIISVAFVRFNLTRPQ